MLLPSPFSRTEQLRKVLTLLPVSIVITLALLFPPFGYLMTPFYQVAYGRPAITRVEFGPGYFGAI